MRLTITSSANPGMPLYYLWMVLESTYNERTKMVTDYPVTTPYGEVPGYPLNNGFHQGIDYGCPTGTPVIVNGVQIGLSGNTGESSGPHCHIGKFVNGVVQDPGIGNGLSFNNAVVYDIGSDNVNGNYVRVTADGDLWNYLHLSEINVTKGQILGETMTASQTPVDATTVQLEYNNGLLRGATPEEVQARVGAGNTVEELQRSVQESDEHKQVQADYALGVKARQAGWDGQTGAYVPYSGAALFIKKS